MARRITSHPATAIMCGYRCWRRTTLPVGTIRLTFTLLVVQFIKEPLDKLVKIPTRIVAYVISAAVMLVALAFTDGFTWGGVCLALANAFISALAASGTYDTITAKRNESETEGQEE